MQVAHLFKARTITDLLRKANRRDPALALHAALIARAREPVFFVSHGVADTPDGRFDSIALHAALVLERLKADPLAKALVDALFDGFAEGLRAQGAGDIAMLRKLKRMADAFYGRLKAYEAARDEAAMRLALIRNLYRGADDRAGEAGTLAGYVLRARDRLAGWHADRPLDFGPLPE